MPRTPFRLQGRLVLSGTCVALLIGSFAYPVVAVAQKPATKTPSNAGPNATKPGAPVANRLLAQSPKITPKSDPTPPAKPANSGTVPATKPGTTSAPKTPFRPFGFGGRPGLFGQAPEKTAKNVKLPSTGFNPVKISATAASLKVDSLILDELRKSNTSVATRCSDEDFLRRIHFDITGAAPTAEEALLFGLDPDSRKREKAVDQLLGSSEYAENWGRYWRDVIFSRATEMRARSAQRLFTDWMTKQIADNISWDKITTQLLTATGDVQEEGATGLIFAQGAKADEVASEACRIFLGIQIQCANCHDHPTDSWKRNQFHELAAFFPRMVLRPNPDKGPIAFELASVTPTEVNRTQMGMDFLREPERLVRMVDRNGDGKINKAEADNNPGLQRIFARLIEFGDSNKDGALSADEIKKIPPPPDGMRRGASEYYMPDLNDPQSRGTKVDPVFFVGNVKLPDGLSDKERRDTLARLVTAKENPWFARAMVNRMWTALIGDGFYAPVDDLGPDRTPIHGEALDVLATGFAGADYDLKWLMRAICNTETYQRQIKARDLSGETPAFASANPHRLRADQLYDALLKTLGVRETQLPGGQRGGAGARFGDFSPRGQFALLFGVDPSTPHDDINGTVPQALFMMNSSLIAGAVRAQGDTRLARILSKFPQDTDAVTELYLMVHSREPSPKELAICLDHVKQSPSRGEAYEDLLWSLINSSEFLSKR